MGSREPNGGFDQDRPFDTLPWEGGKVPNAGISLDNAISCTNGKFQAANPAP